jgi:diacylglycerol kinase (ATP)
MAVKHSHDPAEPRAIASDDCPSAKALGRRQPERERPAEGHVALVANEGSGGGLVPAEVARELERAGARVESFEVGELEAAIASGPRRLVIASGDGAIGPAAAAAASARIPLAVVPAGTANDFARVIGVPGELGAACRLAIRGTRLREMDLARMDGRPFVNAASTGLAVAAAERARPLRHRLGPAAYALGALGAAVRESPLECRVTCDGRPAFDGRAWQVTVASTGRFGGGSRLESADPRDGRLDVAVLAAGPRLRLAAHAYGLRRGNLTAQRGVRHGRGVRVEVGVPRGTAFNVDGEVIDHGPARFTIEPGAFRVVTG